MLEVKIDTLTVDKGSLWIGLTVEGPKKSWIRFAQAEVPLAQLDWALICAISEAWDRESVTTETGPTLF